LNIGKKEAKRLLLKGVLPGGAGTGVLIRNFEKNP